MSGLTIICGLLTLALCVGAFVQVLVGLWTFAVIWGFMAIYSGYLTGSNLAMDKDK